MLTDKQANKQTDKQSHKQIGSYGHSPRRPIVTGHRHGCNAASPVKTGMPIIFDARRDVCIHTALYSRVYTVCIQASRASDDTL